MRRTRWLFLVAILFIVVAVGATYLNSKRSLEKNAPARPKPLARKLDGSFSRWTYSDQKGTTPHVEIFADHAGVATGSGATELEGVEMKLYNKDGKNYDLVKTAKATCVTIAILFARRKPEDRKKKSFPPDHLRQNRLQAVPAEVRTTPAQP